MSAPRTLPLGSIVGRSLYNVRPDGDPAGRDAMAASIAAVGQLQALIVRVSAGHPNLYEVDDGGCRWDAMKLLVERDAADPPGERQPWDWNTDVAVLVVNGDAGVAWERSLAANVIRRQLHPVEECEAFAAMVADGLSIETVAADFGVTVRYVRQRLKLDGLSPRARAAWRAGTLSAAAAEVLTGAVDHEAQETILDAYPAGITLDWQVGDIKHKLRLTAMAHDAPEALYVGLDSYVEAGGRLDEQLFEAETRILDPMLMKRLARQAMMDEGLRIAERYGFGAVIIPDELPPGERYSWGRLSTRLSEAERAEVDRLHGRAEAEVEALPGGYDEAEATAIEDRCAALEGAVEMRALARCTTEAERRAAAVFLSLDHHGKLVADMGRTQPEPKPEKASTPAAKRFAATAAPDASADTGSKVEPARQTKALIAVMDEAMSRAYAAIVAERPYLAMVLATAAITARTNGSAIRIVGRGHDMVPVGGVTVESDASRRRPGDFTEAVTVALTGARGREDVMLRFARAVAGSIIVAPTSSYVGYRHGIDEAAKLAEMLAVYGDGRYHDAMASAMDYRAYFAAATKGAILDAIHECGGPLDARSFGKMALVETAATLCRDRGWLPPELREPDTIAMRRSIDTKLPMDMPPIAEPSLADAMAQALEAGGADLGASASEPLQFDPQTPDEAVRLFLERHCLRDDERYRIKAQMVFDAFRARMPPAVVDFLPTMQRFGAAIAAAGITKRRTSDGFHYCGLDLRSADPLKQAAE